MNKRFYGILLLLLLAFLFLTGCETGGKLKIYNKTSHLLFAGIHGELYTIGSDSTLTLDFATPTESIFNPDTSIEVDMFLSGETFQIFDEFLGTFVDSTFVVINTGETYKVYANPNRACVKVINQSQRWIKKIIVQRNTVSTSVTTTYDVFMAPGDTWFKQQIPSNSSQAFFYVVQIQFENDDLVTYGDIQNVLYADDLFLVEVLEPEE
ncbi:MAG: hypothetical protein R6V77_05570 [Candidatus Cloacimonadaceae bacterium]